MDTIKMEGTDYIDKNYDDNVTREAWSASRLQPNERNEIVSEIINQNPLKPLFDERNDSSIEQMTDYVKKARESIDSLTEVLPTCGELSESKELVMLFRTTPKIIGAGNRYPFNKLSLIIGPKGIFLIRNLGEYGSKPFQRSIDASFPSSAGVAKPSVSIEGEVRKKVEAFEQNPKDNKGKLLQAYEEISTVVSKTSSRY
jgi:hypothetical protein